MREQRISGWLLAIMACSGALLGCHSIEDEAIRDRPWDKQVATALFAEGPTAAVISQRTLYPYHFMTGKADLSPLGEQDLQRLADYYHQTPGPLAMRLSGEGADKSLTQARRRMALDYLVHAGVARESIVNSQHLPDSPDWPGEQVDLRYVTAEKRAAQTGQSANGSGNMSFKAGAGGNGGGK